jgi:hypothetical protein
MCNTGCNGKTWKYISHTIFYVFGTLKMMLNLRQNVFVTAFIQIHKSGKTTGEKVMAYRGGIVSGGKNYT